MGTIKPLQALYFTQFLSAFADNAIFFVILGILANKGMQDPESQMVTVQAGFLLAYVLLAPFVGTFADRNAKSNVLLVGNIIKCLGVFLLILGVDPAIAYFVVGIGAVVYSPAKYGILPDLTSNEKELLQANGKLEGFTIAAIIAGTVAGGKLADYDATMGIIVSVALYVISILATFFISKIAGNRTIHYGSSALSFFQDVNLLFKNPKTNFSLVGTGAFWMVSAVLRIGFLIWLATYLQITEKSQQSMIVGVTGIGVVIGAFVAPYLVSVEKFYKSYLYGFAMTGIIIVSIFPVHVYVTAVLLLLVGVSGAILIIPCNTLLQNEGKNLIGAGKTIAIQNFVENVLMLAGIAFFKFLLSLGLQIMFAIGLMGILLGLFVVYLKVKAVQLQKEV